jgi:hypothetical protein
MMGSEEWSPEIYPGIDIDIQIKTGQKHTSRRDVLNSVKGAFAAGVDGVVLRAAIRR